MRKEEIKADVVVVGGGMAGLVAAVAAVRGGAKVVLIEENGYLGGTATTSMLGELNGFTNRQQKLYGGLTAEIVDNMISQGFARLIYGVQMTGNPSIMVDRVRYDPEQFKLFLDELLTKENVTFLLHSTFSGIEEATPTTYKVSMTNHHQCIDIESSIVIDATGNAEVVFKGKGNNQTWKPSAQTSQAVSLIFRMGGIDTTLYNNFNIDELRKMILAGYDQGFLPAKYCAINLIAGTNDAIINMTRISGVDHELITDMTRAEVEGRRQINNAVPYLKQAVPGFEKAYISAIAPIAGVREARRIKGRYTLTQKDILAGTKFVDAVATGCYPMDIHGKKTHNVDFTPIGGDGIYTIPYASLLPINMDRVIVAGKCISVDAGAFAAIRTMPTVMSIGEAAGTAAALSCKHNVLPHTISASEIQTILKANGHVLP